MTDDNPTGGVRKALRSILRARAEGATPGPWVMTTQGGIEAQDYSGPGEFPNSIAQVMGHRDWLYIASVSPNVVLELLDAVEAAEARAKAAEAEVERLEVECTEHRLRHEKEARDVTWFLATQLAKAQPNDESPADLIDHARDHTAADPMRYLDF